MTTVIMPVPVSQNIPTCPDCRQELPDHKIEYCTTCHQEICEDDATWGDIFLFLIAIAVIVIAFMLFIFPIGSWIASDNTTLVREYVSLAENVFDKLKTIW